MKRKAREVIGTELLVVSLSEYEGPGPGHWQNGLGLVSSILTRI